MPLKLALAASTLQIQASHGLKPSPSVRQLKDSVQKRSPCHRSKPIISVNFIIKLDQIIQDFIQNQCQNQVRSYHLRFQFKAMS